MGYEGVLRKMQSEMGQPIQYYLIFNDDFLNVNQVLDKFSECWFDPFGSWYTGILNYRHMSLIWSFWRLSVFFHYFLTVFLVEVQDSVLQPCVDVLQFVSVRRYDPLKRVPHNHELHGLRNSLQKVNALALLLHLRLLITIKPLRLLNEMQSIINWIWYY